ncbi:MAG: hypothetical protein PHN84_08240 [Desulfuromonadaceae bacterium]|nr:hypothetical protein [Desulfuromonadaceae bacterium]MDD2856315.1 hypothetical protein [Desulfuromonadaceae bacterium]
MDKSGYKEKLLYIAFGAVIAATSFILLAATDVSAPNYGRYQISSWSSPTGKDSVAVGAFVLDTATGETKVVYHKTISAAETGLHGKDNLRKQFYTIK